MNEKKIEDFTGELVVQTPTSDRKSPRLSQLVSLTPTGDVKADSLVVATPTTVKKSMPKGAPTSDIK